MRTIERDYRKNPHTASFLQVFHTGIGSNGRNYREEIAANENRSLQDHHDDLLDLVPESAPVFRPSPAQETYILNLTNVITGYDGELGRKATDYTHRMNTDQLWTPENTTRWISNLIAKRDELRAAAPKTGPAPEVADGRYAVEEAGELKFFKVKNGRKPGFVFLDIQASDDLHSIRDRSRIARILALIAANPDEASLRYGRELGICGDCGRTLTTETSRARGRGPVCDARH